MFRLFRFIDAATSHFKDNDDNFEPLPVRDGLLPTSQLYIKVIVPLVDFLDRFHVV